MFRIIKNCFDIIILMRNFSFQPLHHVACQGLVVEIMATDIPTPRENNPLKALQVAQLV